MHICTHWWPYVHISSQIVAQQHDSDTWLKLAHPMLNRDDPDSRANQGEPGHIDPRVLNRAGMEVCETP